MVKKIAVCMAMLSLAVLMSACKSMGAQTLIPTADAAGTVKVVNRTSFDLRVTSEGAPAVRIMYAAEGGIPWIKPGGQCFVLSTNGMKTGSATGNPAHPP